jgi:very-short-patch-repair endonuclease
MPDPFDLSRDHREWLDIASRALRRRQTASEEILWQELCNRQLAGLQFRRQHRIGPFVVDFFCFAARLVIEVDGAIHDHQQDLDAERDALLIQAGYQVLRVTVDEVEQHPPAVLTRIHDRCDPKALLG